MKCNARSDEIWITDKTLSGPTTKVVLNGFHPKAHICIISL